MSKLVETIPFIGVRGDVLIETRDAKSGKLAQRSEGHNLFTDYGLERFRKYCAMGIGGQFGRNMYCDEGIEQEYYNSANSSAFGFLKYLYLTDNTAAVSASDRRVPGTVTGLATRAIYSGSAANQGNINMNETVFLRSGLKAVFDFGTDRGNGMHKSIFWADRDIATINNFASLEDGGISAPCARQYTRLAESNDGYFYGSAGTTLYKINPTTMEEVATYTLPATPYYQAIFDVTDGVCVFTTSSSSTTLYVFTLSDSTSTTKTLPNASMAYGGAVIGGYLYYSSNGTKIYKFDVSAGTGVYQSVSVNIDAVCRCGNQLYLIYADANRKIYSYDYSTNVATECTAMSPLAAAIGVSMCNTYSLTGKLWQMRTIQSNNGATYNVYSLQKLNLSLAPANMITGRLLDTPIEKLNTQTMKVTYTISFS